MGLDQESGESWFPVSHTRGFFQSFLGLFYKI
jgi:hypothetical protein